MNKLVSFIFLNVIAIGAVFASDVSNVTVDRLMIDSTHGDLMFVQLSGLPVNMPECSTNGTWQFTLALDNSTISNLQSTLLMSAYLSKSKLRIIGTDQCEGFEFIEDLRRVELL